MKTKAFWENETKTKTKGFGFVKTKTKRKIFVFKILELVKKIGFLSNFHFFCGQ